MTRLDNKDIGLIWARHYTHRCKSQSSKSLCLMLAMILKYRAESIQPPGSQKSKFEAVEAESKSA